MAHTHGDADHAVTDVPRPLRRLLTLLLIPPIALTVIGAAVLWPRGGGPDLSSVFGASGDLVGATVTAIDEQDCDVAIGDISQGTCSTITARLTEGDNKGDTVNIDAGGTTDVMRVGSRIVVSSGDGAPGTYYYADFQRDRPIVLLVVLFVVAAVAFGRSSGVRALAALAASLVALVWFVLPAILQGHSPIAVALVGASMIMVVVLYVTGGFTTQSTVAVLGTMASFVIIAALAWLFVRMAHFTGLANEDAVFLQAANGEINLQGLLLGGIVIGSLGVLDDMTVTQVSAVWELRKSRSDFNARSLYAAAERIGRDHIASTINTLVLAYAGASLPLLIYFTQSNLPLRHVFTNEVIAVEIVRALVGSVGLIASVPLTTALAAYVVTRPNVRADDSGDVPLVAT
ncbi:MAG TPA: YibE/F family protein [Acidimicrobiales bacterium]|nr:YibE/F family protein [Acidimicrobiales bacterium]